MPARSKIRWAQLKVGLIGLTAIAIAIALIFLLTTKRGLFTHNVLLRTYMQNAAGITNGSPVMLNGINIGYLDQLRLTNSPDPKRAVEFDMRVNSKYLENIPVDSLATIANANLLGNKFLNINRGTASQHVKDGDELRSLQGQDVPELMASMANVLDSLQTIANRVDRMLAGVEQGKGSIGKILNDEELYNRFTGIAQQAEKLLVDARTGGGTISKLIYDDALYKDMQAPIKRIDAILADLQAGRGTVGKLMKDPKLYDEATQTATTLKAIFSDLQAGKGTAGKLLRDDRLSQRVDDLMVKLNTTIDKINEGQGTIGQLVVNPQLYESLNGATHEFQGLAKDIRRNPKEFLRIKLALF